MAKTFVACFKGVREGYLENYLEDMPIRSLVVSLYLRDIMQGMLETGICLTREF